VVQNQPREIVHETLSQKYPTQKRAGGLAEFKPQYHKKRKKMLSKVDFEIILF
jgi:hypothetical protein